jgi:hypothetical protein
MVMSLPFSDEPTTARRAERENGVRVAAMVAAQNRPLPPAVVDFIVSTSDWRQSQNALEARAAGIADFVVHDVRAPNFSSATPEAIRAYLSVAGREFGDPHALRRLAKLGIGADLDPDKSSAAFDGIASMSSSGLSRYDTPAGQAEMRNYAMEQGLHWAADKPELLRLGPAAIKTFADMKFERESYRALREDAGTSPKKIHEFVAAARDGKVSPELTNDIAKSIGETAKGLPLDRQRELMDQWTKYLNSLKDTPAKQAEEKKKLEDWHKNLRESNPEKAREIDKQKELIDRVEKQRGRTNSAEQNTDAKDQKADAKEAGADAKEQKADTKIAAGATLSNEADALLGAASDKKLEPTKQPEPAKNDKKAGPARPAADQKQKLAAAQPAPGK